MTIERPHRHFEEDLGLLKTRLLEMGGIAEDRLRLAVRGLVERDLGALQSVLTGDLEINQLHIEIDDRCFKLLALQQPMAADLRAIVAAVKINSDLERVGDLAVNIAEAALRYVHQPPVKELIDIPRMGVLAQGMLRDVDLAKQVLNRDDELDLLKSLVFRELLAKMAKDPSIINASLDLILVSRHLERTGDHATNIAEDVIFMVSAQDVRHKAETT
jgi:phosphate transport system protein